MYYSTVVWDLVLRQKGGEYPWSTTTGATINQRCYYKEPARLLLEWFASIVERDVELLCFGREGQNARYSTPQVLGENKNPVCFHSDRKTDIDVRHNTVLCVW